MSGVGPCECVWTLAVRVFILTGFKTHLSCRLWSAPLTGHQSITHTSFTVRGNLESQIDQNLEKKSEISTPKGRKHGFIDRRVVYKTSPSSILLSSPYVHIIAYVSLSNFNSDDGTLLHIFGDKLMKVSLLKGYSQSGDCKLSSDGIQDSYMTLLFLLGSFLRCFVLHSDHSNKGGRRGWEGERVGGRGWLPYLRSCGCRRHRRWAS